MRGKKACFARHFALLRNSPSTVSIYADECELLVFDASLTSARVSKNRFFDRLNKDRAMPCPYEMLMFSPGASGQENQNGENLQSACQHCQRQHNFGYATIDAEIAHRANSFHTGTDVVKTG